MEISGRPDLSSDEATSMVSEDNRLYCDPCLEDGKTLEADGYCVDCEQYLCSLCFQTHLKPKPCRYHKLLDKTQILKTKMYKDQCTDKCKLHQNEIINYCCEDHEMFGCSVCVTLNHRNCKVGYIPTLSEHLFDSQEYQEFKHVVESLANKIKIIQYTVARNLADIKSLADSAFQNVTKFREEVNNFFNKLEQQILDKITQHEEEDRQRIETASKTCLRLESEIRQLEKEIKYNESKGHKYRLYIDTKRSSKTVKHFQNDIKKVENDNYLKPYIFKQSDFISNLILDTSQTFGFLDSSHKIAVHMDKDIMINCTIENIAVLPNGKIAVTDSDNKCVTIIDTKQGMSTVCKKMSEFTHAITAISDNEIAVTQDGNIEIYSVGDQIKLKKTIRNAGLALSLVYTNNRFIGCTRSFPYRVRMVNMKGKPLKTFPTVLHREKLFVTPWYITINSNHTVIYVSDFGNSTLTSMSIEGTVKARYKYEKHWWPRGVAVSSDGLVYVNDRFNNVIHILTADLQEVGVIDGKRYGISDPEGLAYCPREKSLYVGKALSSEIVVLNV